MSYSAYAAGSKTYNGVSSAPNTGPTNSPESYAERDRKYATKRRNAALLKRIQARQKGRYMSADNLSAPVGRTL